MGKGIALVVGAGLAVLLFIILILTSSDEEEKQASRTGLFPNPRVLPERCIAASGFDCRGFKLVSSPNRLDVEIELVNQVGRVINILDFKIQQYRHMEIIECTVDNLPLPVLVTTSNKFIVNCELETINYTIPKQDKTKVNLDISFVQQGRTFNHTSAMEIFGIVE